MLLSFNNYQCLYDVIYYFISKEVYEEKIKGYLLDTFDVHSPSRYHYEVVKTKEGIPFASIKDAFVKSEQFVKQFEQECDKNILSDLERLKSKYRYYNIWQILTEKYDLKDEDICNLSKYVRLETALRQLHTTFDLNDFNDEDTIWFKYVLNKDIPLAD